MPVLQNSICTIIVLSLPTIASAEIVDGSTLSELNSNFTSSTGSYGRKPKAISIDARRSLVVTEQPILARFSLERVLDQLVEQSGVPGLTALELFQQWWDTQNPGPGLGLGAHCDDQTDSSLGTVLNGYPYTCRSSPSEGSQAMCDPFSDPIHSPCAYIPVGLFNRFDLAPEDGSHCGEYRIVFAKRTGITDGRDRVLLIFESGLPNPLPNQGIKGCRKIVKTWTSLTEENDIEVRADILESFYFNGHGNIPPVVHIDHYGDNASDLGQIRSNQFSRVGLTPIWSLREFKLIADRQSNSLSNLGIVPVTNKVNPFGPLFSPTETHPNRSAFQNYFPSQIADLAADDLNAIGYNVPDIFNSGQSQASASIETDYGVHFTVDPSPLRSALEQEITAQSLTLTPDDVVQRAQTQSCAGCHRISNNTDLGGGLMWPASSGFTHVDERRSENVDGVLRFEISPALIDVFLPHRKSVMEDYLNNKPKPPKGPKFPIGGSRTHG